MKAKLLVLFTAGFFLFPAVPAFSQSYEDMPAAVRKKMDENKQKGVHLLEGVKVDYEFTITGVKDAKTAAAFESFMKKEFGLFAFSYNTSNNHVRFTSPAKYSMEDMKSKMKGAGYGFDLFFQERYHL